MAFALPRISLIHPNKIDRPTKQAAFAATWEEGGMPTTVGVKEIDQGIRHALSTDPKQRLQVAEKMVEYYRRGFEAICAHLK